ncbi:MAG: AAA family ATPase [Defluviitaleaceae bacterium]|nr:AAA family ATPase [Defluviitaleaceae bacterium]
MKDQAEKLRNLVNSKKPDEKKDTEEIIQKPIESSGKKPEKKIEKKTGNNAARVITIASGKGGVGKSNFVLNVAINMNYLGKRVCIIDADFGMANISTLTGKVSQKSLAQVLNRTSKIEEIIEEGPGGVHLISGGSGLLELSSLSEENLEYLIKSFSKLDNLYDIILIDTGAGAGPYVTNLMKAAGETIIVTTPEPTSLIDAYSLIKIIKTLDLTLPNLYIAINRVESFDEGVAVYKKIDAIVQRYTGLSLSLIGLVPEDDKLKKAVKAQLPLAIYFPNSTSAKNLKLIATRIIEKNIDLETSGVSFLSRLRKIF